METVNCLDCGSEIVFRQNPKTGMLVTCSKCGAELQVVWLDPLEIDWPFIDNDDDDDDEDEDDELYDDDDDY